MTGLSRRAGLPRRAKGEGQVIQEVKGVSGLPRRAAGVTSTPRSIGVTGLIRRAGSTGVPRSTGVAGLLRRARGTNLPTEQGWQVYP